VTGSIAGTPCVTAPDCAACSSGDPVSTVSTKLRMVVPSSSQCSTLMPAVPSANTMSDTALSNHRLPLSPWSNWSQAARSSAGVRSSRHTQNNAVSMVSSAAALPEFSASNRCLVAAHSARAMVVR